MASLTALAILAGAVLVSQIFIIVLLLRLLRLLDKAFWTF